MILEAEQIRFGFLTTIDQPLLPHYLAQAHYNGVKNIYVICDSKKISEKDHLIWSERTGGFFDDERENNPSLYSLGEQLIPFYFVDSHNSDASLGLINRLKINCLFNAGTPRKLSPKLLESVKHGILNIHPGKLPEYRGCSAVEWAIYNDERVGNTAHYMSEAYDNGPIIEFEGYVFPKNSNYNMIRNTVYQAGCSLAGRILSKIQNMRMIPSDALIQDETVAKYWGPIPDEMMREVMEKISTSAYKYQSL